MWGFLAVFQVKDASELFLISGAVNLGRFGISGCSFLSLNLSAPSSDNPGLADTTPEIIFQIQQSRPKRTCSEVPRGGCGSKRLRGSAEHLT